MSIRAQLFLPQLAVAVSGSLILSAAGSPPAAERSNRPALVASAARGSAPASVTEGARRQTATSSKAAVANVRFWTQDGTTIISVEANAEFQFKWDRAVQPDRLFFDLLGTHSRVGKRGYATIPVGDALVKQIRVAERLPGVTRVVLDLQGPVEHVAKRLPNPERLVIEVRQPGRQGQHAPTAPAPPPVTARATVVEPAKPGVVNVRMARRFVPPPEKPVESLPEIAVMAPPSVVPRQPSIRLDRIHEPSHSHERLLASVRKSGVPGRERRELVVVARDPAPGPSRAASSTAAKPAPASVTGPATPAKLPGATPSMTRALGLKVGRIVLDAGHGGHDQGTSGPTGLLEKELVLDVTMRLGAMIEERLGAEVLYTRTDDTFIPLENRTAFANEKQADLFLSIHANSSPIRSVTGVETYYLNFTTNKAALELAARENAASNKSVHELSDIVRKIALNEKVSESREFAARVQSSVHGMTVRTSGKVPDRGVKKAPFVVLIGAAMPSVLCEVGFVSNPRDEQLLKRPEHRQKLAEALYKGLFNYAQTLSHFQVAARD